MTKKVYYPLFVLLIAWSIWSLSYSPLPWLDEVFYASTTHSLVTGHGLSLEIDHYEPVVMYGPVYFLLTGAVAKVFGFGIFQFRIVNLLFAFLSVLVLGKTLDKLNVKKGLNYFSQLLLLTDALFISNSHSGRMEFVALFFILLAINFYLNHNLKTIIKAALVALMLTLAALTSLRAIILCIPIAIAQLISIIKERSWISLVPYLLIPVLLYGIWVYIAFGSVSDMLSYFSQQQSSDNTQRSLISKYAKGNWMIYKYHYPMVVASLITIVFLIKRKKIKEVGLFIITVLLFYLFVTDTGLYGVYVLPFYMIIISVGLSEIQINSNKFLKISYQALVAICLLVNCSIFTIKVANIISTKEQRDPQKAAEWLAANIPSGSKVAGDYIYFYSAIKNGCQFKRIHRGFGGYQEDVLKDVIDNFQPDYIILEKNNQQTNNMTVFRSTGFVELSCLENQEIDNSLISRLLKMVGVDFMSSYEGCIYAVTSEK